MPYESAGLGDGLETVVWVQRAERLERDAMRPGHTRGVTSSNKGLTETEIELRRTCVFHLRADRRLSFRAISAVLGSGVDYQGRRIAFDLSSSQAQRDYWNVMRRDGYTVEPTEVVLYRADQLEQCERVKAGLVPKAFMGDCRAVTAYLRVLDHEAKLMGLYDHPPAQNVMAADEEDMDARVEQFLAAVAEVEKRRPVARGLEAMQPGSSTPEAADLDTMET